MNEQTRRAEERLRRDIDNDQLGRASLLEAEEAERLRVIEQLAFERGRASVLRQLVLIRSEILAAADRSDIVGQWMDGIAKAQLLGDVIEVLGRR